jgi:hypothetical protein
MLPLALFMGCQIIQVRLVRPQSGHCMIGLKRNGIAVESLSLKNRKAMSRFPARTVYRLHAIGYLHRGIRPQNVVSTAMGLPSLPVPNYLRATWILNLPKRRILPSSYTTALGLRVSPNLSMSSQPHVLTMEC